MTAASSHSGQVEPFRLTSYPLDVLCQQLLGMATQGEWSSAEAAALVRRAYPYRDLPEASFHDCLAYLSGRSHTGEEWLPARLRWSGDRFTIADDRTVRLLRRNIGTIITEEPRAVRFRDGTTIGEVDETYVERLQPGDRFLLDGRCLQLCQTERQGVLVEEVSGRPGVPHWAGEGWPLSSDLARRLYLLRTHAGEALREGPRYLVRMLCRDYHLAPRLALELTAYFEKQEAISEIPDARTCLVEVVRRMTGVDYYIHTPLNRAGNEALVRVVTQRLARSRDLRSTSLVADLGFALFIEGGEELTAADFGHLFSVDGFSDDLDQAIDGSESLRQRFRRTALTGLMLLRHPLGRRRVVGGHDWPERHLFQQVRSANPQFVLLRQARNEIREEFCDVTAASAFLADPPERTLRWRYLPGISPFAEGWTQAAAGPVEWVDSPAQVLERLHATLTSRSGGDAGSY